MYRGVIKLHSPSSAKRIILGVGRYIYYYVEISAVAAASSRRFRAKIDFKSSSLMCVYCVHITVVSSNVCEPHDSIINVCLNLKKKTTSPVHLQYLRLKIAIGNRRELSMKTIKGLEGIIQDAAMIRLPKCDKTRGTIKTHFELSIHV